MSWTGKKIKETFKDLLKLNTASDNAGVTDTVVKVQDGDGNDTALSLSSNTVTATNLTAGTAFVTAATILGETVTSTDINGGTIDSTTIGGGVRAPGAFSSLGVAGAVSSESLTKLHREDPKTQLELGDLVFQKTGTICANFNSKEVYKMLQIMTHGVETKGNFIVSIECLATSGTTSDGSSPASGTAFDVSLFRPDGLVFAYSKEKHYAMQKAGSYSTNSQKGTFYGGHSWYGSGSSIPAGAFGAIKPYEHLFRYVYANSVDVSNNLATTSPRLLSANQSFWDRLLKTGDTDDDTTSPDGGTPSVSGDTFGGSMIRNALYEGNFGEKLPLASDAHAWAQWNYFCQQSKDADAGSEAISFDYNGATSAEPNPITVVGSAIPVWNDPGTAGWAAYDSDTEDTWEVGTYLDEFGTNVGTTDSSEYGYDLETRIAGGSSVGVSVDQIFCITYNVKVISSYDGENGRGYVKGVRAVNIT